MLFCTSKIRKSVKFHQITSTFPNHSPKHGCCVGVHRDLVYLFCVSMHTNTNIHKFKYKKIEEKAKKSKTYN